MNLIDKTGWTQNVPKAENGPVTVTYRDWEDIVHKDIHSCCEQFILFQWLYDVKGQISCELFRLLPCSKRSAAQRFAGLLLVTGFALQSVPAMAQDLRLIEVPALRELSGLAVSRTQPQLFWAHNDSGNAPLLFLFDQRGRLRTQVEVPGADALDWEDMASFEEGGQSFVVVADTGDNLAWRSEVAVLILAETAPAADGAPPTLALQRTIRFRYEGGPRDVEALAVDVAAGQILLLEKRRPPAQLFVLDLHGPDRQLARPIATLRDEWPEAPTPVETIGDRRYRGAVTAMDLSTDGRHLALLTSTHWMLLSRAPGEAWAAALQRPPLRIERLPRGEPNLRKTIFEALAWGSDGAVWISGEHQPAPLLRMQPFARSAAPEAGVAR